MRKLRFIEFKQVVPGYNLYGGGGWSGSRSYVDLCLSSHCVMLTKSQLPVPVLIPPRRKYEGLGRGGRNSEKDTWV